MERSERRQNDGTSTGQNKLMTAASAIAASTSPGSPLNMIAVGILVGCTVSTAIPSIRPTSVVKTLKDDIVHLEEFLRKHKDGLEGVEGFESKVKRCEGFLQRACMILTIFARFKVSALDLEKTGITSWKAFSLKDYSSWSQCLSQLKHVVIIGWPSSSVGTLMNFR
ncbi:hypothetical protein EDD85DRAFT_830952 [Armillaria nabsnona]|nr:hypothetical protein EDD85DRAFT_830952 [Armillaria nabsnona]